ncbi:FAD-dependent oxidoreductase [Deinococcus pimensis]|uniref:FAD-dependent oxidoreductase n=1 Tax=Deinococcus pimensis TaxID=309888 RepID=UPI00048777F5|nr:FAD-dependent monooxygenase [Deinococcus pimensis]
MSHTTARNHAVVIGASIAGLLAARVLSEHYARVTIVERDVIGEDDLHRRGVPQGRQPHALLSRGMRILEDLHPGLGDDLRREGALTGDMTGASRLSAGGEYLAAYESGLPLLYASRVLIERCLRRRTLALPNVTLLGGVAVRAFTTTPDRTEVTGLTYEREDGARADLPADLVLDASGRGSRTPAWLEALGYARAQESRIDVNVAYTSRIYRRHPEHLGGTLLLGTVPQQPMERRVAICTALEGDRWHFALAGWFGEHAPADEEGFLEFARGVGNDDIPAFLETLEPLTDFTVHRYPASVRRHYERARLPLRLLVLGDAMCSFNPTYGQGMTVAALEAEALRAVLRRTRDAASLQRAYFRAAAKALDLAWSLVSGGDGSYPEVDLRQPLAARITGRYFSLVQRALKHDGRVLSEFMQVVHMVRSPLTLFEPSFVIRVLRAVRREKPATRARPSIGAGQASATD